MRIANWMNKVFSHLSHKLQATLIACLATFAVAPVLVFATPYGCGTYGNSTYNDACPATSSSTTKSSGGSTTTSSDITATDTTTPVTETSNENKTTYKPPVSAPAVTSPSDNGFLRVVFSPITISLLLALLILAYFVVKRILRRNNRI